MTNYRITAVEATNYKRLRDVRIEPAADAYIILIGGANAQGKTSLLDALDAAFGGKRAVLTDPVRHGADSAEVRVELESVERVELEDGVPGALLISRQIDPDGSGSLEVRDEDGPVRAPQALLDRLVGRRSLDAMEFLRKDAAEQRAALLKLIDADGRIATLDQKRERATTRRTEIGRELGKAKGELARLPEVTPGQAVDIAALAAESRAIEDAHRELNLARTQVTSARLRREQAAQRLDELRQQVERAEAELAQRTKEEETFTAAADRIPAPDLARRDAIAGELARAQAHNSQVAGDEAAVRRRAEVAADVERLRKAHAEVEGMVTLVDQRKAELLAAAKLPVEGLGVSDAGVTLNGVPLQQASGAERLRVSIALAIAGKAGLQDIWIRDGALLDDDSLALVAEAARAAGVRLWVERVGERDAGALVIHDGRVKAAGKGKAA